MLALHVLAEFTGVRAQDEGDQGTLSQNAARRGSPATSAAMINSTVCAVGKEKDRVPEVETLAIVKSHFNPKNKKIPQNTNPVSTWVHRGIGRCSIPHSHPLQRNIQPNHSPNAKAPFRGVTHHRIYPQKAEELPTDAIQTDVPLHVGRAVGLPQQA